MNINEISVAYLKEKEQRRRASTVDGYRSSINLYILPEFGDSEIETIESEAIQSWVDSFGKPGAAEKAFKCLRQLFNWAIRKYRLRIWNPTQGIELPAKPIYRPKTITANETAKRLRGFYGHKDETTVIVSTTLALRPGESYGIRWDDINWRNGAVSVPASRPSVTVPSNSTCKNARCPAATSFIAPIVDDPSIALVGRNPSGSVPTTRSLLL